MGTAKEIIDVEYARMEALVHQARPPQVVVQKEVVVQPVLQSVAVEVQVPARGTVLVAVLW